jgi:hypothetical protein
VRGKLGITAAFISVLLAAVSIPLPGFPSATGPRPALAADGTCGEPCAEPSRTWFFAEGYTGQGFQEWLCLFNPGEAVSHLKLDILYNSGAAMRQEMDLPARSRTTLDINSLAGADREVSLSLQAGEPILAERPMYFTYRAKWKGCSITSGVTAPAQSWFFAEGCTRPGFEEWILLANPRDEAVAATVFLILEDGGVTPVSMSLPARSRQTVSVNRAVGEGRDVGARVEAEKPICAERAMYFDYRGSWPGGHASTGLSRPRRTYLFAEGYTGAGFEEWLSLYLPGEASAGGADVQLECLFPAGKKQSLSVHLDPDRRHTLNINDVVGRGTDVSLELSSDAPFLAERPMYFNYKGVCRGGHVSKGVEAPGIKWYLAEGTIRPGFDTFLCLMNPGDTLANVEVDFIRGGSGAGSGIQAVTEKYSLPAASRLTLEAAAEFSAGLHLQADLSFEIRSDQPIAVERPVYHRGANFEVDMAMEHIRNLSLGIGPRVEGTAGEEAAAGYIAGVLSSYGYQTTIQEVPLPNGSKTRNVIAVRKVEGPIVQPQAADLWVWRRAHKAVVRETMVIGAHYDTKTGTGSPGANDNASGTATVLELARCLSDTALSIEPRFVLFGGEERLVEGSDLHHFGSRYFVSGLSSSEKAGLRGAVIVDMVGVGGQLYARTMGVGPMNLCNSLMSFAAGRGIHLPYLVGGSLSDHEPFEAAGIPAVWLEVKDDPYYHTSADSYDKINPAFIDLTGRLLEEYLRSL